jgi:hypothetical protein
MSVTSNVTMFNTSSLWKKVYHNPNLTLNKQTANGSLSEYTFDSEANQSKNNTFRFKANKKIDDFNFTENLQKLGLDDSKSSSQNLTNVQGSYLSYLLLRHLRIRDLKRQVYFFVLINNYLF